MRHATRPFVLFDFDGVIADSFACAYATARARCVRVTPEAYQSMFDGNVYDYVDPTYDSHGTECNHGLDWWGTYIPMFEDNVHPFPGMVEAVRNLSHRYNLAIISSSIASPIQSFLARHNIDSYIDVVLAADTHQSKKVKITMLHDRYGLEPTQSLFVTDTLGDVRESREVGVETIAVSWGFHPKERLLQGSPAHIVDTPSALVGAIDAYFAL